MPTLRQNLVQSITRMYPLYSGCANFSNSPLLGVLAGDQGGQTWCKVAGGDVWVDLTDYIGRSAFFVGDLDRKITWICRKIVGKGDTVLDIGANIGVVTVLLSKLVGAGGRVHSFEPNPRLVDVLRKTAHRNGSKNVVIHDFALGEKADYLDLAVPPGNAGAASLIREDAATPTAVHRVRVLPLDDIIEKEAIKSIRLIKIDVEGFEEMVFKGASKMLRTVRPDAILFELNRRTTPALKDEPLIKLLRDFDYDLIAVPKCMLRMRLKRMDADISDKSPGHDFLACPRGSTFEEIARRVNASA